MQPGHHGADRDAENLCSILVAEVADVDEHDHVAEVVRHLGQRGDDVVLREPFDDTILVGRAVGLRELVVQVVVVRFERLQLRRTLIAPSAIDVEVRQDPQQPRAQIRTRRVRAPASKCARVRLLDEIVRLFPRVREMPRDAVDLVGQPERLLFEADAPGIVRVTTPPAPV